VSPVYYVESWSSWFCIHAPNKRAARREGRKGGMRVKDVRRATEEEATYYRAVMGEIEEAE
jgi:hypothetical protein